MKSECVQPVVPKYRVLKTMKRDVPNEGCICIFNDEGIPREATAEELEDILRHYYNNV